MFGVFAAGQEVPRQNGALFQDFGGFAVDRLIGLGLEVATETLDESEGALFVSLFGWVGPIIAVMGSPFELAFALTFGATLETYHWYTTFTLKMCDRLVYYSTDWPICQCIYALGVV